MRLISFSVIVISLSILCLLDFINMINASHNALQVVLPLFNISPLIVFALSFCLCLLTTMFAVYRIAYILYKRCKRKYNK